MKTRKRENGNTRTREGGTPIAWFYLVNPVLPFSRLPVFPFSFLWVASTVLFLCIPARGAEVLVCPAWEITVVDESGKPMAGCAVVQEWGCQFRGGYADGSAAALTDAAGKVQFPARSVSPPPLAKKSQRGIDRPVDQRPAASITISKSGCKFEWLQSRNEPRNVYSQEGIRSRVVLKRESMKKG